ncbi:hypothetical protein SAMN05421666_1039 [Roseovarius nanhaiticus]|uniref:Uncharacterized protein n=1 Tax=Roseovarius nanhaiticus TaxID=573024 RepID=A0A1N7FH73_9RHOB|nr:hypothetical protein [Roseovarius nanhaiticus]SEK54579.1 hypothetical protein SAMN05216208_1097 [Roseovarius nanhaiticus]SIR99671.1 hypothetical protein SAMN05421666_1039 [Roseovarius nanhaiticus]
MSRLGIYAEMIEEKRKAAGLTPAGFREDGTDSAASEKEEMLRKLYERTDAHLPSGIGGQSAR